MKTEVDMMKWWSAMPIDTKKQVAGLPYPECSAWWNTLTLDEKIQAYKACGIERAPRNKTKGFT